MKIEPEVRKYLLQVHIKIQQHMSSFEIMQPFSKIWTLTINSIFCVYPKQHSNIS